MVRTDAKAATVLLAAVGTGAQGFLPDLSQQAAAWIPPPTTTGSPLVGGPAPPPGDGGAGPYGTTIISWSTQHFTVTTGFPEGPLNGTGTEAGGGSIVTPTPAAGGQGVPQASEPGEVITDDDGNTPPTAAGNPGGNPDSPPASVSANPPSEPARPPPPDIFVIQLGPAGAAPAPAAIESGGAGPRVGRRQDDQYLMSAGTERPGDCAQAARFEMVDGELTRGGQKVSTGPGAGPAQRLAVSPPGGGSITRSWEIVGGELLWLNESFVGGRAGFCVDEGDRAVFFTTTGQGGVPAGCTPERLTPMFVADCPGLSSPGGQDGVDVGGDLLPAEETLALPPGVYFPGREPKGQACRVTTEFWTVGQFTVAPAPTGLSRRLW